MNSSISDNTKAILLLTAPLIVGKGQGADSPLSLTEYNKLARNLCAAGMEPVNLLQPGWEETLADFDLKRIGRLLERGFLLSQAISRWQERAIWVVSRADDEYPHRLKKRLGRKAPPVLYGCGNQELMEMEHRGLAVVGSRNAGEELLEYSKDIGALASESGVTIISGAARGVDQAAMLGALSKQGTAIGVLAGDLEREALNPEHREMLMEGNLALISQYDPKAGFHVGNAMGRNKLIYALANAGLVVESDNSKGGTWTGAAEQLDKLRFVPVYTRSTGEIGAGLRGLQQKGARRWPAPETPDALRELLADGPSAAAMAAPEQASLIPASESAAGFCERQSTEHETADRPELEGDVREDLSPAEDLFAKVEQLINSMSMEEPVRDADVSERLQIGKKQAKDWLDRLVKEGKYRKLNRPARYEKVIQPGFNGLRAGIDAPAPGVRHEFRNV